MLNRLDLREAAADLAGRLPRPEVAGAEPVAAVRAILDDVRSRGDAALRKYSERFDGVVPEGAEARFEVIAVGTDGARTAMPVKWTLNRVETRYQWYQLYGGWQWEPVTSRSRVK